jgi:hypothetical protein
VKLCAKLCDFSLHKFWDRALGTSESPELAQTLQGKILGAPNVKAVLAKQGAISSEATWLEESFNSAKKFAYAEPVGPDSGPYTLNDTYRLKAGSEAEKRIALAGQRLANLLNQELK